MKRRIVSLVMGIVLSVAMVVPCMADEVEMLSDEAVIEEEIIDESVAFEDDIEEEVTLEEVIESEDVDDINVVEEVNDAEDSIVTEEVLLIEDAEDNTVVSEDGISIDDVVVSEEGNVTTGVTSTVMDGYEVTVKVADGVLPVGAKIDVVKVSSEDVNEDTEDGTVVKSIEFDVVVTDAEGNVIDIDKAAVEVSVKSVKNDGTYAVVTDDVVSEDGAVVTSNYGKASYTITVIQPNKEDKTAPVLKSMKLNKKTYHRGDSFELEVKVTDDLSGFNQLQIIFYDMNIGESISAYVSKWNNDYYDEEGNYHQLPENTYRFNYVFNTVSNGTYVPWIATVYDEVGNVRSYANDEYIKHYTGYEKFPKSARNIKFKVEDAKAAFSPSLNSLTISPTKLKVQRGEMNKFKVAAKTSCKSGEIDFIRVEFVHKYKAPDAKQAATYVSSVILNPKKEGSSEFVGSCELYGNDYEAGTWKVDKVIFFSKDKVQKEAPSSKYKNKKIKITVEGEAKPSVSGLKVKDIKFDDGSTVTIAKATGDKYQSGAIIPFTVDLSGVKKNEIVEVVVRLYNKKTGKYISAMAKNYTSIWYGSEEKIEINSNRNVAKGSFYIDLYEQTGDYIVDQVSVWSRDKNYKTIRETDYGRNIAGKNNLTSQMKKFKMKIKKK